MINLQALATYGDMTGGGGIAAIKDASAATVGYSQSTSGWVGFCLAQPTAIDCAEIVSADNGFDASGLTTLITAKLYGKTGTPPTSRNDGIVLGQVSMTDTNVQQSVTIPCAYKTTQFDYVWVTISTGMWCILSGLRLFEAVAPAAIQTLSAGRNTFTKSCNAPVALMHNGAELPHYRVAFHIDAPRVVSIDYHADVVHEGSPTIITNGFKDSEIAVGYSFSLTSKSSATEAGLSSAPMVFIPSAVGGGNVSERNPQHYGNKTLCTAIELAVGYHEISVFASGHTDGTATQGILKMLVEGDKGLNALRVSVEPVGTVFHT